MNIKRAFLAAAAVLMMPGLAMAQTTATFATTIDYSNGDTAAISTSLTCNSGNPLVQVFDIAPGGTGVTFTVANIDVTDTNVTCEVALSGLASGYEAVGCTFDGGTTLTDTNTCAIMATPEDSAFAFIVDFDDSIEDPNFDDSWTATTVCSNVSLDTSGTYTTTTFTLAGMGDGGAAYDVFADPAGMSECMTTLENADALANDGPCMRPIELGTDALCLITVSTFFEGIPTLSQYGMAIMVLLMLGVGFVGFRRFV